MRRQLYEVQRAMRARREAALKRGVIAVLDIGTSKVACLVLQFVPSDDGEAERGRPTLTQGAFRVIGASNTRSRGVAFGEIAAMEECERAIRTAIQAAQKMANLRVDHVIVSFAGGRPRSYGVHRRDRGARRRGGRARHRPRARRLRDPRLRPGPRGAARAAGELLPRQPLGPDRPARADRQDPRGGHASADHRRDAAAQRAALHPPLRPRARRRGDLALRERPREPRRGRAGTRRRLHRHRRRA